jgi:hypothetical protein
MPTTISGNAGITTPAISVSGNASVSGTLTTAGLTLSGGSIAGVSGYIAQNTGAALTDIDRKYIVSNTAAITLTLPATNTDGRTIVIVDGNNFESFNVTLARNGRTIAGLAEDLILNLRGSRVELVYRGGDWKVFAF